MIQRPPMADVSVPSSYSYIQTTTTRQTRQKRKKRKKETKKRTLRSLSAVLADGGNERSRPDQEPGEKLPSLYRELDLSALRFLHTSAAENGLVEIPKEVYPMAALPTRRIDDSSGLVDDTLCSRDHARRIKRDLGPPR